MKQLKLLLVFITMVVICQAQIDWGHYSQSYLDSKGPQLIAAIPGGNNSFWSINSPSVLKNNFEADKDFMSGRPGDFVAITTFDREDAQFFVTGAGKNKSQFEYRVLKDGKQVIAGWSPLIVPASESVKEMSTIRDLMYIGGFKTEVGHYLVVDLRSKDANHIVSSAVVSWQPIRPTLFNIYTVNELNGFLQRLSHPDGFRMTDAERKKWQDQYGNENLDAGTGLPKKMLVEPQDNSMIFVLRADIREKELVQYELVKDNNITRPWGANDFDNNFIWLKDLVPGNYILRIRYTAQPGNTLEYLFDVKAPPAHSAIYYLGISSMIAAFLALIIVLVLYLRQKLLIKKESLQRAKLELEMKGIRSQLNPHFIFNSLNSIQGLINTGRIRESNEYIAVFAKIMRDTLTLSDIHEAPLQQEIDYLDAYLRLEQLRFNFKYHITVDPSLHTGDVNFPSLLLQPLVENAVKHGIQTIKDGQIDLCFSRKNADLIVTVRDNGKGFAEGPFKDGYGLGLTRQRIQLLNAARGEEYITLQVQSNQKDNTQIQIVFKGWLNETDNSHN